MKIANATLIIDLKSMVQRDMILRSVGCVVFTKLSNSKIDGLFCGKLKLYSTAALACQTGQNKGRYRKKRALIPTHLVA